MTDVEAIWARRSAIELARRLLALQDELAAQHDTGSRNAAALIGEVLHADYNPLPDKLPELSDPPTLRPAVPHPSQMGPRPAATEPGS